MTNYGDIELNKIYWGESLIKGLYWGDQSVFISEPSGDLAWQEANGIVTINAQSIYNRSSNSITGHAWEDFNGTTVPSIRAEPNNNTNIPIGNQPEAGPSLVVPVDFTTLGPYQMYLGWSANNAADDSIYGRWDDANLVQLFNGGSQGFGNIVWSGNPSMDLSVNAPGRHTMTFSMREDGLYIHRIILAINDPGDTPTRLALPESVIA